MAEMKLFKIGEEVAELKTTETSFDENLQDLIQNNSKLFFGVTFVANNYQIGAGTIPTVGLDENRCPVVFVYNKDEKMNSLSKGLFFIDQLCSFKDRFTVSVSNKLGKKAAESIDWSSPRVILLASGFNKYDRAAVAQVSRNISLIQYNQYEDGIVMFELIESNAGTPVEEGVKTRNSFLTAFKKSTSEARNLFNLLCEYVQYFGDSVTINTLNNYVAFKKIKNFGAARVDGNKITLNLNLDPYKYLTDERCKDVTFAAKVGTGHLQFTIETPEDYEASKQLLLEAYNKN